jgi:two-component system chemotaxis response regulator CheY
MTASALIVDDEYGLAELMSLLLGMRGFDASIAINGEAGLALARAQPYNLIVTDVMMPLMDGIEMIRRIRAMPEAAETPIIVMTALPTLLAPEERALAQGVLAKPFGHEELFKMIDEVLPSSAQHVR